MPNPPSPLNRRLLLGGALGIAGIGAGFGGAALILRPEEPTGTITSPPESPPTLDFEGLHARAAELLVGGEIDPDDPDYADAIAGIESQARALWESMNRGDQRTAVWDDFDPVSSAANFNNSYRQLYRLAIAWATPGTEQHGDEALAAAIVEGLALLYDGGYNERAEEIDNWYWWEIGSPAALMRTCVLLFDHIPAERMQQYFATVDRWCPDADMRVVNPTIHETGSNRADKAVILALRGILAKDDAKLRLARDGLSGTTTDEGRHSLFQYVTDGDGFYKDGSLIQHDDVPYAAAYGTTLLGSAGLAVSLLAGSAGEVTDENIPVLYDSVELNYAPFLEDALFMDCLYGRGISRPGQRDYHNGAAFISAVTQLAVGAPQKYRERWYSGIKGWVERTQDTFPYTVQGGIPAISRMKSIMENDVIVSAPRPEFARVYANMERAVARRAGWSWALSMSSNRVAAYEMGNWENLHGWYLGDGMTYLYLRTDPRHFSDEFWPTVNPYRLPGTTVDTRVREVIGATEGMVKHLPDNDVAGGASLVDRYAVAAMQLIADGSTLRAKKAWFVLDNAIVALGADINATDGRNVVTTVEHRNLGKDGTNRLTVNGDEQPAEDGWSDNLDGARWIHLEDVGGYLFPEGAAGLRGLREVRTGAWNDIEQGPTTGGGDTTIHTRRYATIWYDHGVSPAAATYAYILLPTADAATTATLAGSKPVNILKNTAAVQAIKANGGDLIAAHFWEAGDVGGITCDGPASVLVHRSDDDIRIAVADSSRTTTQITVEIPFPATEVAQAERTVEVELSDRPRIIVQTGDSLGTTHKARLKAS